MEPLRLTLGAAVCGRQEKWRDNKGEVEEVIPIAGDYTTHNSRPLNPVWTSLKQSSSKSESRRNGIRLALHGGQYPFTGRHGTPQKAIINFICDRDRTGLERGEKDQGGSDSDSEKRVEVANGAKNDDNHDDEDDGDHEDDNLNGPDRSLRFVSYNEEEGEDDDDKVQVLRLDWRTKWACEGMADEDPEEPDSGSEKKSGGRGFFTWLIIV